MCMKEFGSEKKFFDLIQYRHIGHVHEGVWFRKKIIFDEMTAVRT